jgi:hypothetical protein
MKIQNLNKLVLSKINLGAEGLIDLAIAMQQLAKFEHLDISNNNIKAKYIESFLTSIGHTHLLKSLNLSYNNCKEKKSITLSSLK